MGCCQSYVPTDSQNQELIYILKNKPNSFTLNKPEILRYYRKYPDKFRKLISLYFSDVEKSKVYMYIVSLSTNAYNNHSFHYNKKINDILVKNFKKKATLRGTNTMYYDDDFIMYLFI
jgi:hypothetical protein